VRIPEETFSRVAQTCCCANARSNPAVKRRVMYVGTALASTWRLRRVRVPRAGSITWRNFNNLAAVSEFALRDGRALEVDVKG
jgi:hypothetical protein